MKSEIETFLDGLDDIGRDIARFENPESFRPHDEEGIRAIEQRLSGVEECLALVTWTSHKASEKIKALRARIVKLREE